MKDEQLKELRAKHGRRCVAMEFRDEVLDETHQFAVRPASSGEFDRFVSKASDDRANELNRLARACTVFPEAMELDRLLEEYPGLYPKLAEQALELAGAGSGALKKT